MYSNVITSVVNFICDHTESDDESREIYSYGLEIILISILNTIITLALAALTNRFFETIIFMLAFYPLQSFGGGYHAQTHFRCLSIFLIGWLIAMLAIPYIQRFDLLILSLAVPGAIIIFLLAPIEHINFPMSKAKKQKMKVLVRCITLFIIVMIIIFDTVFKWKLVTSVLSIALLGSGLSMLSAFIKQRVLQYRNNIEGKT